MVNPSSKPRKLKKHLKKALRILKQNGFRLSIYFTKGEGEVLPKVNEALEDGCEALIVAGGDGSVNEAINGIVGKGIPLGILPFGGSNVLARELRIPLDPEEAAKVIVRRNLRRIDLGKVQDRYFSMMASCGYDAYAISRTNLKIKKWFSRYAYIIAGIKDFMGYRPTEITLVLDNGKVIDRGTLVVVSNTHFYGGTHEVTPFAEVDDGFLDICIYQGKYQIQLVHFALNVLSKKHLKLKNVHYYRIRKVYMTAEKLTYVQIDGDLFGALPVTVEIVPETLEVFS
ncbi:MAG TPA: diacylglycerol kinase family protein [bacterium]